MLQHFHIPSWGNVPLPPRDAGKWTASGTGAPACLLGLAQSMCQ